MNCEEFNKEMEPMKLAHKIAMRNLGLRQTNILYESMTRIQWGDGVIRVWRQEEGAQAGTNLDLYETVRALNPEKDDALGRLLEMDRVNAVEIVDAFGCGMVAYKNWP